MLLSNSTFFTVCNTANQDPSYKTDFYCTVLLVCTIIIQVISWYAEIAPALMLVLFFMPLLIKKNRHTLLCLRKMKVTCKITLCTSFLLLVDVMLFCLLYFKCLLGAILNYFCSQQSIGNR